MSLSLIFNGLIPENPISQKLDFVPHLRRSIKRLPSTPAVRQGPGVSTFEPSWKDALPYPGETVVTRLHHKAQGWRRFLPPTRERSRRESTLKACSLGLKEGFYKDTVAWIWKSAKAQAEFESEPEVRIPSISTKIRIVPSAPPH